MISTVISDIKYLNREKEKWLFYFSRLVLDMLMFGVHFRILC